MLLCRSPALTPSLSYHTFFGGGNQSLPTAAIHEDQEAKDLRKLLEATRGYFEKLNDGNPLRIGPWQILWWQPRYYHAEHDAFCHQPISTTEATLASGYFSLARPRTRPTGKPSKIHYSAIQHIEIREAASGLKQEFVLHCTGGRSFTFKMQTEEACEKIVANIRELIERSHNRGDC